MHNIYRHEGKFSINHEIPKIVYSTFISVFINTFIRYFSLSEKNVISLRNDPININEKEKTIGFFKCLKLKFIIFFFLLFSLVIFFWYYLSCLCGVYQHTQIHLIKDSLISFGISLLYPFGFYLLPTLFRISSLKSLNKECMYNFSKILQFL